MTRSRLILVLRCCLLAAIALWFGVPWYFVLPVALSIPAFAIGFDCGISPNAACNGGTAPVSLTVTGSGFSAGCCATAWNNSFLIPYSVNASALCRYVLTQAIADCAAGGGATLNGIEGQVVFGSTHTGINVIWKYPGNSSVFKNTTTLSASPMDCSTISGVVASADPLNVFHVTCELSGGSFSVSV